MPIVVGNPLYQNQYGFNGQQPVTTQLNLRQMVGEVQLWNPDVDPFLIGRWINNMYRRIIDRRFWYGLLVTGQIVCPQLTSSGTATTVPGSKIVTGTGTNWTQALIGQQFRIGFTNFWQTITNVDPIAQTLTLNMPYGAQAQTSGYQIAAVLFSLGANVKYIVGATNQQQGWPMLCNIPVWSVNAVDTWRTSVGWSKIIANREPTPDGQLQVELFPTPYFQQVFPFWAYTQPPDLLQDTDSPVMFIRSDVLVLMATAEALTFRGKQNKYYDLQTASSKRQEAEVEMLKMEKNDDCMFPQDVTWDYGQELGFGMGEGSLFGQSHDLDY